MMWEYSLPKEIQSIVAKHNYYLNEIGMTDSEVRIYENYVLKIQPRSGETDNEFNILNWVGNNLPVPEIIFYIVEDGLAFTLMSRVSGNMLCDDEYLSNPQKVISLVAQGFQKMWSVDVQDCPYIYSRLTERLKTAEVIVDKNLVDVDNTEPETFGTEGFNSPKELLQWLKNNRPEEDIVFTHGDYCLPNIFAYGDTISSFIDLGKAGPADRWQDIAIAIRSLTHNFDGTYTDGKKIYDFKPQMLIDELGIEFDEQKYRYYLLLDELF